MGCGSRRASRKIRLMLRSERAEPLVEDLRRTDLAERRRRSRWPGPGPAWSCRCRAGRRAGCPAGGGRPSGPSPPGGGRTPRSAGTAATTSSRPPTWSSRTVSEPPSGSSAFFKAGLTVTGPVAPVSSITAKISAGRSAERRTRSAPSSTTETVGSGTVVGRSRAERRGRPRSPRRGRRPAGRAAGTGPRPRRRRRTRGRCPAG